MFMVGKRRANISDKDLENKVLVEISSRGSVIESELYPLSGAKYRITSLLQTLLDAGILEATRRTKGQKVPEYSLTQAGEIYLLCSMMMYRILRSSGEIDLEDENVVDMRTRMRVVLHMEDDGEEGPDPSRDGPGI